MSRFQPFIDLLEIRYASNFDTPFNRSYHQAAADAAKAGVPVPSPRHARRQLDRSLLEWAAKPLVSEVA